MTYITERQWVDYFGFRRFPFDRPEAGNEEFSSPDFLAACFVQPASFERVLGQADAPVTALLFAARGTGKTACRVMVDYYCQQGEVPLSRSRTFEQGYVLSVPHIYLDSVLSRVREAGGLDISVEDHAYEILGRAVPALAELMARVPELERNFRDLSPADRQDLSWFVLAYGRHLRSAQLSFLHELGVDLPRQNRQPLGYQTQGVDFNRQPTWVSSFLQDRAQASPLDHLALWARLVHQIGIHATYVLVDGLDETSETAADPRAAFEVVKPLLACLRLMDSTLYLAFKFFLPADINPLIQVDSAIRHDRGFVVESINWKEEHLIEILRRRLDALRREDHRARHQLLVGFDALCVPELRGQIEQDLAREADGNPRHLLLLCGKMVENHCNTEIEGQDDPYQLNKADFQAAVAWLRGQAFQSTAIVVDNDDSVDIPRLITRGEGQRLEFKATLQWDIRQGKVSEALRRVIAKSIAGMLNAEGGMLLIGVKDDGTVRGIEHDLRALRRGRDEFQLALQKIVRAYLKVEYLNYLSISFESVEDKTVCVVSIEKSPEPVYLLYKEENEFWVRLGNATHRLDLPAAMRYINSHWGRAV